MSVICCDICPFSPTCEEEEDQVSHSYRQCDHEYQEEPAS